MKVRYSLIQMAENLSKEREGLLTRKGVFKRFKKMGTVK